MYLVDTNIWLERMLDQARSRVVGRFLGRVPSDRMSMTDFSLHSIGVILHRLNRQDQFLRFVEDLFVDGAVSLVSLEPADIERLVAIIERFGLDFDDAHQYVAAELYDLQLVSFDSDFDRTERGRTTPEEILDREKGFEER